MQIYLTLTRHYGKFLGNNICPCHCGVSHNGDSNDA